jgi:peroxisomal membrane protein 2
MWILLDFHISRTAAETMHAMRAITFPYLIFFSPGSVAYLANRVPGQTRRLSVIQRHQFSPSAKTNTRSHTQLHFSPVEAWDAYNEALVSNPLLVKSVTAGVILGAADLAGQSFESIQKGQGRVSDEAYAIDWARAARFAVFGLVLQAPWNHFYYQALDGQIPPTPSEPFSQTNIIKIVIDQFIQAPIFTVLIFAFLGALEGKNVSAIQTQLRKDYKETIFANCTY